MKATITHLLQQFEWLSVNGQKPLSTLSEFKAFQGFLDDVRHTHGSANKIIHEMNQVPKKHTIQLHLNERIEENLLDWITFWQFQFKQHVMNLDLLLVRLPDAAFSKPSVMTSELPENQPDITSEMKRKLHKAASIVDELKSMALPLVQKWTEFQKKIEQQLPHVTQTRPYIEIHVDELYHLCKYTFIFKFIAWSKSNEYWLGPVQHTLVQHFLEELVAFVLRLSGELYVEQEIVYLTNIIADHIGLVAHSIDPNGSLEIRQLVLQNLELANQGHEIIEASPGISIEQCQAYIQDATQFYSDEMNDLLGKTIPNNSLSVDVYHMQREHLFAKRHLGL